MTNIEHLLENALHSVDKSVKNGNDCYSAFEEEMNECYNRQMLENVNLTVDELWLIVQYVKFCREKGGAE